MKIKYRNMVSSLNFSFHFWQMKTWKNNRFSIVWDWVSPLGKILPKKDYPWVLWISKCGAFPQFSLVLKLCKTFLQKQIHKTTRYNLCQKTPPYKLGVLPFFPSIHWPLVLKHLNILYTKFDSKWIWCENMVKPTLIKVSI
jgi:hypothetical protein